MIFLSCVDQLILIIFPLLIDEETEAQESQGARPQALGRAESAAGLPGQSPWFPTKWFSETRLLSALQPCCIAPSALKGNLPLLSAAPSSSDSSPAPKSSDCHLSVLTPSHYGSAPYLSWAWGSQGAAGHYLPRN